MAKFGDILKDEGNATFVNFVIKKMMCKHPRVDSFVIFPSNQRNVHACVIRKLFRPLILSFTTLANKPPLRRGGYRLVR